MKRILIAAVALLTFIGVGIGASTVSAQDFPPYATGCVTWRTQDPFTKYWYGKAGCSGGTRQIRAWLQCTTPYSGSYIVSGNAVSPGSVSQAGPCQYVIANGYHYQ